MIRSSAPGLVRARFVPFVVVCALACGRAHAEESGLSVVTGRVVGSSREPVAGVEVRLQDAAQTLDLRTVSAPDGTFRIERVPAPGIYQLACVLGRRTAPGPRVVVHAPGEVVTQDVPFAVNLSEEVSVTADAWTLPVDVPNSIVDAVARAARASRTWSIPRTPCKYTPNTMIRKRYAGDRNALVGGRSFGTLQPSRGLVYLDGYLLSNFLGRFDAPRWNMVTPRSARAAWTSSTARSRPSTPATRSGRPW